MPTVLVWKGYRFFFYSNEGNEPPHVHVKAQGSETKVWFSDLIVARNQGFADRELKDILRHIVLHRRRLLDAWRDHFDA